MSQKRERELALGEGVSMVVEYGYERKMHRTLRAPTHTPPFEAYLMQVPRYDASGTGAASMTLRAPSPTYQPVLARSN